MNCIRRFLNVLVVILSSQNLCAISNTNDVLCAFNDIRKSLVIIETDGGCGSGFIVVQDGKKYLMTNYHVIANTKNIKFSLLDGKQIKLETVELSDNLDLARFALKEKEVVYQALKMSADLPSIGETIHVYGNSDGKGVVTEIPGQITGVGPEIIEVDATFVRGNSGSPIINQNGEVVGVATFVTRNNRDWVARDTRFENVRRFGYRPLTNDKWVLTSISNVYKQTALIENAWSYLSNVYWVTLCWTGDYEQVNQAKKTFENYSVIKSGNETVGNTWEKNISFFYSTYKSYWNVAPKNKQGVTQNSPNSFAVQSAKRTMLANFKKLTKDTDDEIQKTKWETKILKAEADMVKKASSSLNETINLLSKDDSIFWRKCILINAEGNF